MLKNQKRSVAIGRFATSMAVAPLFFVSVWVAIDGHQVLLAQAPETAPVFKLPASLPQGTTMKVDGSDSMTVINEALKQRFEEKFPGTTVTLTSNGTANALKALTEGTIDLAAVGRPLTDAEKAQGLKEIPISREKIAIIVGAENSLKSSITAEQFAKMFRGEITNWSQVGGADLPIRFIDRPATSDTRQALSQYPVFKAAPFQPGANAIQMEQDDTAMVIRELGKDGISYAIASQVTGQPTVAVLPMHDTLPTDPLYPYSQPRGYVYRGEANPGVQAFIGFATSAPGQEVVAAARQQESTTIQQGTVEPVPVPSPDAAIAPDSSPDAAIAPVTTGKPLDLTPLLWLLLPLLGLPLLMWLMRGRGAVVPPLATEAEAGRMILTPRNCRDAYAYWEVPDSQFAAARNQGGRDLKVRLSDVTGIRDMDRQPPHELKEFDCVEHDQDMHLPIAVDDRDYVAELGYLTADNQWIRLARSEHVRVPACPADGPTANLQTPLAVAAGTAAVAGAAAIARSQTTASRAMPPSRVIMVPRTPQDGYVYWEVPEARKAELKQQGGQNLMVRLHDTTNINLEQQAAHSVRQYQADEQLSDVHVPILTPNRDYVAELGYATQDNRWLSIAKSAPVHVPLSMPGVADPTATINAAASAAATQLAADIDPITRQESQSLTARFGSVTAGVTGLAEDAAKGASGLLGKATETASNLTGDATKVVGAAIAGGTAAVAGFSPTAKSLLERHSGADANKPFELAHDCRIILVPRNSKDAYAYWEVADAYKQALREQGGRRLMLRVHDATNLDIDYEPPHSTQTYVCHEADQDKHVVIPVSDRDYIAELGYFTDDNRWLRLIRSFHVRVPAAH
ncbi:MAG: DUF4912 domain-containing protein [Leptolyngbyaceae cyanobacterium bins.349]|nr:DUF4912 domain-containing protein [Leptolyngbyaceae cyanobacterium bins.349]